MKLWAATLSRQRRNGSSLLSKANAKATTMATVELFPITLEPALIGATEIVGEGQVPLVEFG